MVRIHQDSHFYKKIMQFLEHTVGRLASTLHALTLSTTTPEVKPKARIPDRLVALIGSFVPDEHCFQFLRGFGYLYHSTSQNHSSVVVIQTLRNRGNYFEAFSPRILRKGSQAFLPPVFRIPEIANTILTIEEDDYPMSITDHQLANVFRTFPQLEKVQFRRRPEITSHMFQALASLKNLRTLDLNSTNINSETLLKLLPSFPNLSELHIQFTKVDDTILDGLLKCSQLKRLYIQGNKLSDATTQAIRTMAKDRAILLTDIVPGSVGFPQNIFLGPGKGHMYVRPLKNR